MHCLISACNENGGLFSLDLESGEYQELLKGNCRGICYDNDFVYVARQKHILVLHRGTYAVAEKVKADFDVENPGLHHLVLWKGYLLLVVSNRNEVHILNTQTLQSEGSFSFSGGRHDRHHYNTLTLKKEGIYLGCFTIKGKEPGKPWPVSDGGFLEFSNEQILSAVGQEHRILVPHRIYGFLDQPHDFVRVGRIFFTTESRFGDLTSVDERAFLSEKKQERHRHLKARAFLNYYARGLVWTGTELLIGIASPRGQNIAHFSRVLSFSWGDGPCLQGADREYELPTDEIYQILPLDKVNDE